MTYTLWLIMGSIFVCLVLSALFSASETALTGFSRPRIAHMAQEGNRRAQRLLRIADKQESLLGSILIGNNLVNILASALATSVFLARFGEKGIAMATLSMTVLILLCSEIVPKSLSLRNPERAALILVPSIMPLLRCFHPFSVFTAGFTRLFLRLVSRNPTAAEAPDSKQEEELRGAIHLHGAQPRESPKEAADEREMLLSVLDLDEMKVTNVMTPRGDIFMLDAQLAPDKLMGKIVDSPFTRMPVFQNDPENIIGVVHAKNVLKIWCRAPSEPICVKDAMTPPWFVPETTTLDDQLRAFRDRREHLACVIDEYGSFLGVITLEDVLETIVGEIADEHDVDEADLTFESDGVLTVQGDVTLRMLNRELGLHLPEDQVSTIGGLVMFQARLIPKVGQTFCFFNIRFTVLELDGNRISKLRLTLPSERQAAS